MWISTWKHMPMLNVVADVYRTPGCRVSLSIGRRCVAHLDMHHPNQFSCFHYYFVCINHGEDYIMTYMQSGITRTHWTFDKSTSQRSHLVRIRLHLRKGVISNQLFLCQDTRRSTYFEVQDLFTKLFSAKFPGQSFPNFGDHSHVRNQAPWWCISGWDPQPQAPQAIESDEPQEIQIVHARSETSCAVG